jgi:alpha-galactosidase/6-phospho-beta-glucosidase family protein
MPETKKFEECLVDLQTEELKEDYARVRQMSLVDDDEYLHNLFLKSSGLNHYKYVHNLLYNFYETKYQELFQKYESVRLYVSFCLTYLCLRNEGELKRVCAKSNFVNVVLSTEHKSLSLVKRRRLTD